MTKEDRYDKLYLDIAKRVSEMSHALRKKVGAVLVKDNNIISFGWNGTPSNFNNVCEFERNGEIITKDEVVHAEQNMLSKANKGTQSTIGATCYLTLSPCFYCAKSLLQSGIKRVVFIEEYRNKNPVKFLQQSGIIVERKCFE